MREGGRDLNELARQVRRDIVEMVRAACSGHLGGSLSAVEVLVALYFRHMRIRPEEPDWPDRDRFILSKGHATPVYYSVLARRGYFPVEELSTFRRIDSRLQGHPDMKKTPGVDFSSGSLGQGLSVGCGMAWGLRKQGRDSQVYVLMGDGECNEGQVWEAAMSASKFALGNVVAIVDRNRVQLDGTTDDVMPMGALADKWRAFGWEAVETDGHDITRLSETFARMKAGMVPYVILADTVKGKGVSFMENDYRWHGRILNDKEYAKAMEELGTYARDRRIS